MYYVPRIKHATLSTLIIFLQSKIRKDMRKKMDSSLSSFFFSFDVPSNISFMVGLLLTTCMFFFNLKKKENVVCKLKMASVSLTRA